MSPDSLFNPARERGLAIADLVAQAGVTWLADRADLVDEAERNVLTRDGDTVGFDFLLLAAGNRSKRALRQGQCGSAVAIPASSTRSSSTSSQARFEASPWLFPAARAGPYPRTSSP